MRTRDIPWVKRLVKALPNRKKELLTEISKVRKEPKGGFNDGLRYEGDHLLEFNVCYAFFWKYSPQGRKYWHDVYNQYLDAIE